MTYISASEKTVVTTRYLLSGIGLGVFGFQEIFGERLDKKERHPTLRPW